MSDQWEAYVKDPRTICRYGVKCYQKNPEHHKTYKHPPKKHRGNTDNNRAKRRYSPYSREVKETHEKDNTPRDTNESSDSKLDKLDANPEPSPNTSNQQQTTENPLYDRVKLPEHITYYSKDTDPNVLEDIFLVKMPDDFFKFFQCLSNDNVSIEKTLANVNLELIGPYDLLLGKLPILDNKELYLIHWRFFYDPPEFQAVLKKKGKSQFHIGYFRDDPDKEPVFVGSNDSEKGCHITPMANNIFGAVCMFLDKETSPFTAMASQKLKEKLKTAANDYNISVDSFDVRKRLSQSVTKTFHGAGIMVPYNKKTQLGYRKLVESDANIKKLFCKLEAATTQAEKDKLLSEIQPVITYANIAVDECDFGTGLEIGIDLFCSGLKELEPSASSSLCSAYSLLNRNAFSKIIQVHLKYRRKGPNMALLSLGDK